MRPPLHRWLRCSGLGGKRGGGRSYAREQARRGRRLALEPLESRTLLSVVTAANADVSFATDAQNMWASGEAATVSADFSKTLVDVDFGDSFGGYVLDTGFQASLSGGFDLGFSGDFDVTGGEVDVDYQTDVSVEALTSSGASLTDGTGGTLSNLNAGDSFILRSSESPDAGDIAMETRFASIGAGLYLDYGVDIGASLVGKVLGDTVVNTGFSKSVHDSVELIGAELDLGTGTGELRLFGGGPWLPGQTWTVADELTVSDP